MFRTYVINWLEVMNMPNRDGTGPDGLGPMFARRDSMGRRGGYGLRREAGIAIFTESEKEALLRRKQCLERQIEDIDLKL